MKKFVKVVLNVLFWTILSVFGSIMSLVFILGCLEGDLSHGIMYYLN